MVSRQTYTYKVASGCAIQADVYRPDDDTICPAILWLHGGALILGDRETLRADQRRHYVNAGYAVVAVDYRLAPEVKLPAIIEDIQDAYRWLHEDGARLFHIDPERVAVIGHSAGGYLTLMSGVCLTPRPRALVSVYGYGDITGEWYSRPDPFYRTQALITAEEAHESVGGAVLTGTPFGEGLGEKRGRFYRYCRQQGIWPEQVGGHDPDTEAAWFAPYCPAQNVTPDYPPTLLIHGDEDTDVPVEQSMQMAEALQRAGVAHELVILPGRGHGFDYAEDDPLVMQTFAGMLQFLEKHLGK